MTTRHVRTAIAASLVTIGTVALAPSTRAQAPTLPQQGGDITVVGCFVSGMVNLRERYVLVRPIVGSVSSVPEATCASIPGDEAIKLQDLSQAGLDQTMLGRWLEITGRLEGNHRSDGVREVHVKSFRAVPVVPPRVSENVGPPSPAIETPPAAPAPDAAIEPVPVATAGVRTELPRSATSFPLIALIGFVSFSAVFGLFLLNRLNTNRD
jgi:hypothetical protein